MPLHHELRNKHNCLKILGQMLRPLQPKLPVRTVQRVVQVKAESWSGMARPGPDPTALLRLYIKYDRLEDAADLAVSFLTQWERQVNTAPHVPNT